MYIQGDLTQVLAAIQLGCAFNSFRWWERMLFIGPCRSNDFMASTSLSDLQDAARAAITVYLGVDVSQPIHREADGTWRIIEEVRWYFEQCNMVGRRLWEYFDRYDENAEISGPNLIRQHATTITSSCVAISEVIERALQHAPLVEAFRFGRLLDEGVRNADPYFTLFEKNKLVHSHWINRETARRTRNGDPLVTNVLGASLANPVVANYSNRSPFLRVFPVVNHSLPLPIWFDELSRQCCHLGLADFAPLDDIRDASRVSIIRLDGAICNFLYAFHERATRPCWNNETRTLSLGGILVREVRDKSPSRVIPILDDFQARGWPEYVESPCKEHGYIRDAVKSLNADGHGGTITRMKFTPDREAGHIYWNPCKNDGGGSTAPTD